MIRAVPTLRQGRSLVAAPVTSTAIADDGKLIDQLHVSLCRSDSYGTASETERLSTAQARKLGESLIEMADFVDGIAAAVKQQTPSFEPGQIFTSMSVEKAMTQDGLDFETAPKRKQRSATTVPDSRNVWRIFDADGVAAVDTVDEVKARSYVLTGSREPKK